MRPAGALLQDAGPAPRSGKGVSAVTSLPQWVMLVLQGPLAFGDPRVPRPVFSGLPASPASSLALSPSDNSLIFFQISLFGAISDESSAWEWWFFFPSLSPEPRTFAPCVVLWWPHAEPRLVGTEPSLRL